MEGYVQSLFLTMLKFISQELKDICKKTDILLAYLPPYFCNYNLIKISFTLLKRWIKKYIETTQNYDLKQVDFQQFLYDTVNCQQGRQNLDLLFKASGIAYLSIYAIQHLNHQTQAPLSKYFLLFLFINVSYFSIIEYQYFSFNL